MLKLLTGLALALVVIQGAASPRVPDRDDEVLERLPFRRDDAQAAELRRLRARVASAPQDMAASVRLARRYFALAVALGDPRYIGYAQAVLAPWGARAAGAPELLLVRAMLKQYRHDFDGALEDLAAAARLDPDDSEAHAWAAAIFMVRADYTGAAQECAALAELGETLEAEGCSAYLESVTGKGRAGYERLRAALAREPDADRGLRLWIQSRLARMAWRLGDTAAADAHFQSALALGITDNFLLTAYAEFLLAQQRYRDVVTLLSARTQSDTLLLRLTLAEHALGLADAAQHARILGERFDAAALRGERLHLSDEARYRLDLRNDPAGALAAAAENWRTQREPEDAEILLEAAHAAGKPEAARPALDWLARTGYEDPRMRRLASALR
ncbi:MAG TPA: hypothetical protein VFV84_14545 [Burkholderiales bacterium]|nr:hypothetical protein [Burkholderiales bacterium]